MRIALVTDAWPPQINGVATTAVMMERMLGQRGHEVLVIHPCLFRTMPCPTYGEIPLALFPGRKTARLLDDFKPEAVHILNEGPVGMGARSYCRKRGYPFTTVFTSKYPEYIELRTAIPARWTYKWFRNFHDAATRTCVATDKLEEELRALGFSNMVRWQRGVDTGLFRPEAGSDIYALPRPIQLYVGRVAVEKNLAAWLRLPTPGSKVVIGQGPALKSLKRKFPEAHFLGPLLGKELAAHYADADVFVFPSLTDTFGIVIIEALSSGLPVAAYPVVGPVDIIAPGETGWLDENLTLAIEKALTCNRESCRQRAFDFPWEKVVDQLEGLLEPISQNC